MANGFSGMGSQERVGILVELEGVTRYLSEAHKVAVGNREMALAAEKAAAAEGTVAKRGFLANQAMFTLRRGLFYTTLGFIGLGAAVIKMGFQYNAAIQTAKVGLTPFVGGVKQAQKDINQVFVLAAKTPFTFEPVMLSVRRFLPVVGDFKNALLDVTATGNLLAGMGIATDAALNRATLQLTHMYNVGHLTGQMLQNLSRDNIPLVKALEKEYKLTGLRIKQMITSGQISAQQAMKALRDYSNTQKGFMNAAARQSEQSFTAAWSTFMDLIRMASGSATQGVFGDVQAKLIKVNNALSDSVNKGKISVDDMIRALDKGLTPSTHMLGDTLFFVEGVMQGFISFFYSAFWIITQVTNVLAMASRGMLDFGLGSKWLGRIIGVLIALLVIEKIALWGQAQAMKDSFLRTKLLEWATISLARVVGFWNAILYGETAALFADGAAKSFSTKMALRLRAATIWLWTTTSGFVATLWANVVAWYADMFVMQQYEANAAGVTLATFLMQGAMAGLVRFIRISLIPTLIEMWAVFWPIALIATILLGLTFLYYRWKAFREIFSSPLKRPWLTALFSALIPAVGLFLVPTILLLGYWRDILNVIMSVANWVGKAAHKVWHGVTHPWSMFGAQHGGITHRTSTVMVGEKGPEILRLPGGSMIQPIGGAGGGVGGVGNILVTVVPQAIYLDGKLIGNSVAQAYADIQARA